MKSPWPVDLAHAKPFRLGDVDVLPASRELVSGERRELLEPLVMQVLVVLSSARGETVSRDDLIDACWGGRAVTDDAVNRVISRLRSLGRSLGGFEVETITKVGYRLRETESKGTGRGTPVARRQVVLAGGAVAAIGVGAAAFWAWRGKAPAIDPEADILVQKGLTILQNNDILETQASGSIHQASALLSEATRISPQSSTAWGALALTYAVLRRNSDRADRPGFEARCRAAAAKALALDPVDQRALAAVHLLQPTYRNWQAAERSSRESLRKNPKKTLLLAIMSDTLGNLGQWRDALSFTSQIDRPRFQIPGGYWRYVVDLWGAGDLQAADYALDEAVKQWPQNSMVWRTRTAYLMYTGRASDVVEILRSEQVRPTELTPDYFETIRYTAEALSGARPVAQAVERNLAFVGGHPWATHQVAHACVALGEIDAAFALLNGYYFAEGPWTTLAPKGGDEDRVTKPLFQPVMGRLWRTAEFDRLLERIGLNDYWRKSRTTPDFRRG